MIEAVEISKSFKDLQVLSGISLRIPPSSLVTIVGPSGAGKTTLLQILGTLSRPSSGAVLFDGLDVSKLNDRQLAEFRNRNIGFVFQFHYLLPEFTALENVAIPALINKRPKKEAFNRASELLEMLGLAHRQSHKPQQMSGGEQQRVAIARALINDPSVIFADEPSGNLDSKNRDDLHQLFFSLRDDLKKTFVIVTHDTHLAAQSDINFLIQDGKIAQTAPEK